MKKTILISTVISYFFLSTAFSQEQEKPSFRRNQIGIQFNPVINDRLLSTGGLRLIETISAVRYGYRFTKDVTAGIDFSCSFPININSGRNFKYYKYFSYRTGFYTRYSILTERRFQLFAEASPYFSHYTRDFTSISDASQYKFSRFGIYAAPGMTLYSKSKRISLDLYYKFSNLWLMNRNKSVFSYKFNYNF